MEVNEIVEGEQTRNGRIRMEAKGSKFLVKIFLKIKNKKIIKEEEMNY